MSQTTRRLLLLSENPTFEDFLECSDLPLELQHPQRFLLDFLLHPDQLRALIHSTTTSQAREYHHKLDRLFHANIPDFFHSPARNLPFLQDAFAQFSKITESESVSYGLGTLLRFLLKSAENHGPELCEIFSISANPNLFSIVIQHIDTSVVYAGIADLLKPEHPEIFPLAWHIFRALAGQSYEIPKRERPRKVFLEPDIDLDFEFTNKHKKRAASLLLLFFQLQMPDDGEFRALVGKWIASLEYEKFTFELFDIAKEVALNRDLKTKVIGWIQNREDLSDKVIGLGIDYLGAIAKSLEWWEAAGVIAKLFLGSQRSQNAIIGAIEIVRGYVNSIEKVEVFGRTINQIVSKVWNEKVIPDCDDLLAAGCVAVVQLLFLKNVIEEKDLLWDVAFVRTWGCVNDHSRRLINERGVWESEVKNIADDVL